MGQVGLALTEFTQRFVDKWQLDTGQMPFNTDVYGIMSPCIIKIEEPKVFWQPQPFLPPATLEKVEQALEIGLGPDLHEFYTTQFAGDMFCRFDNLELSLIQVWSEDDFIRLQENLIGHLVTQRRLKISPSLFIATLADEMKIISVCNITDQVIIEHFGTSTKQVVAPSLTLFLQRLTPLIKS